MIFLPYRAQDLEERATCTQIMDAGHSAKHFYEIQNVLWDNRGGGSLLGATLFSVLFLCAQHGQRGQKLLSCQHLGKGRIFLSGDWV